MALLNNESVPPTVVTLPEISRTREFHQELNNGIPSTESFRNVINSVQSLAASLHKREKHYYNVVKTTTNDDATKDMVLKRKKNNSELAIQAIAIAIKSERGVNDNAFLHTASTIAESDDTPLKRTKLNNAIDVYNSFKITS